MGGCVRCHFMLGLLPPEGKRRKVGEGGRRKLGFLRGGRGVSGLLCKESTAVTVVSSTDGQFVPPIFPYFCFYFCFPESAFVFSTLTKERKSNINL